MSDGLERDPEIARALRDMGAGAPTGSVDWDTLHRNILRNAEGPLSRLRRTSPWWQYMAGWGRAAIPLALAAILAILTLLPLVADTERLAGREMVDDRDALTMVVTGEMPEPEAVSAVLGANDQELLLESLMGEE